MADIDEECTFYTKTDQVQFHTQTNGDTIRIKNLKLTQSQATSLAWLVNADGMGMKLNLVCLRVEDAFFIYISHSDSLCFYFVNFIRNGNMYLFVSFCLDIDGSIDSERTFIIPVIIISSWFYPPYFESSIIK